MKRKSECTTPRRLFQGKHRQSVLLIQEECAWAQLSQNEPPKAQEFSHDKASRPPRSTLCPLPLLTLCLKKKKRTSVSRAGSVPREQREVGLCAAHTASHLTRSRGCFPKLRGLTLTQQRKSLCLWGITPTPIRKTGYRGEEACSLNDQPEGPRENRDLCQDHLRKGRMLSTFFSPKNSDALRLDPQKPDPQEQALAQGCERSTRDAARSGVSPRLSIPNICTHIPKMFPLHWNGYKFLSCRILSKQTAMNCTPAGLLNQAPFTSSQQIFQMPNMTVRVTGPEE